MYRCLFFMIILSAVFCWNTQLQVKAQEEPSIQQMIIEQNLRAEKASSILLEGFANEKVFQKNEFKLVRQIYSKFFEQAFDEDIKIGFGSKHKEIVAWLEQNQEIKETLYTAIDPEVDQVSLAFKVFADLYAINPETIKAFPNVAIACAVVWDSPQSAYDYRGHQLRTKSTLPEGVMKNRHVENFKQLTSNESLKSTIQNLPWEMMVHVVNHFTPATERSWAIVNHKTHRQMIGTIYKDIKYDTNMLATERVNGPGMGDCKIGGKAYTLENLKSYGGVCAQQADYSARVAKSMGIPAEYVSGEGNSGGRHAWVMWVEIKSASKDKLDVQLLSEGRYNMDQYYVGKIQDPKSGRSMTDRELELKLATIVISPKDGRQADLLMRVYPIIKEKKNLQPKQQLEYIRKVVDLFPYNDRVWTERSQLVKTGGLVDETAAVNLSDSSFRIFHNYPDFSWKYANDILTPVKNKQTRANQFEKLARRYEELNRPDLACEARLQLVEYQIEAKDYQKAADGLSKTIAKFPAEGRYVPKMLDQLQIACQAYKGGNDKLAKFYLQFLPTVPPTRGTDISEYAIKVHEQAFEFFRKTGKTADAKNVENRIAVLRRGGK